MTKLEPLGDRIVVRSIVREEMTKSGIVLPETAKEKPQEGEVIAVGPGRILENGTLVPLSVAVGDKVLYAKYAGTEIKIEDDELLVLNDRDVLAKLLG
jgi:chaperonin GroES